MVDSPESNAFRRAAELFGGVTPLSHWLKVPSEDVRKRINGEERPPRAIYARVLDTLGSADKRSSTADTPQAAVADTPGVGLGVRVMVADDDRDALMTLGILLRSEGFDVRLLSYGAEVATAVREFRPHAVLLNLGMRDRGGLEVARELTEQYGSARPVLIALTAQDSDLAKTAARICAFHHHISKPYDADMLVRLLAAMKRG